MFDDSIPFDSTGGIGAYSTARPFADLTGPVNDSCETYAPMVRSAYELHSQDDDFGQIGTVVRAVCNDAKGAEFVDNALVTSSLGSQSRCSEGIPVLAERRRRHRQVDRVERSRRPQRRLSL